ncbi:MAG: hypothetical protein ABR609_12395 [Acidimicrobiia bacterium]
MPPTAPVGARERFLARSITEFEGELWLVRLDGVTRALHLTHQANLDALGVDERISTERINTDWLGERSDPDPLLDTCGQLADAVYNWWDEKPPALVYRARTIPSGRNLAFCASVGVEAVQVDLLRNAAALHAYLLLQAGFIVPDRWLA